MITSTQRRMASVLPRPVRRSVLHAARRVQAWLDQGMQVRPGGVVASAPDLGWWTLDERDEDFITTAYRRCLSREPDDNGLTFYSAQLAAGQLTREDVVRLLTEAAGGEQLRQQATDAFHHGRVIWTRSLPRAKRILDLGGTALHDDRGALVAMGYPYSFDQLTVVELPPEARNALYKTPPNKAVDTDLGRVEYVYRSMCDLDDLPSASYDMICSAQSFEHVHPHEGVHILSEVQRLLAPGGVLALDTPNGAITSLQARQRGETVINPDHKKEYTHPEMTALFADAGLALVRAHGIGYMPRSAQTQQFEFEELVEFPTLFDDIEKCYTLAYLATSHADAAAIV